MMMKMMDALKITFQVTLRQEIVMGKCRLSVIEEIKPLQRLQHALFINSAKLPKIQLKTMILKEKTDLYVKYQEEEERELWIP